MSCEGAQGRLGTARERELNYVTVYRTYCFAEIATDMLVKLLKSVLKFSAFCSSFHNEPAVSSCKLIAWQSFARCSGPLEFICDAVIQLCC